MLSILHLAYASPLPPKPPVRVFLLFYSIPFFLYPGLGVVFTLFYDVSFTIFSIFITLLLLSGQLVFFITYVVIVDSACLVLFHGGGGGGGGLFDIY